MKNKSGIIPMEYKVLVKPHVLEEKTEGGIIIAKQTLEKEQLAEVNAQIVAVGGQAFDEWQDERLPKPGDDVMIAKYAGLMCKGFDGEEYRLINDKDIAALLEKTND